MSTATVCPSPGSSLTSKARERYYPSQTFDMSTKESKKEKAREVIDILQEMSVLLVRAFPHC